MSSVLNLQVKSGKKNNNQPDETRQAVLENYRAVAKGSATGCGGGPVTSCCTPGGEEALVSTESLSKRLGYSEEELKSAPKGADMGLGCGNPQAIAALRPGETVLDLGSGGGFDCFLAARQVGESGRVIGVDVTPEMVQKSRENAKKGEYPNVEFRLGEIEHLPVADQSVDAIISNCVINLSPDKPSVFQEAFRVLRAGGRLAVADVVATAELPAEIRNDMALLSGCVAGAASINALVEMIEAAGFREARILPKDGSREFIRDWTPGRRIEDYVVSATIEAVKPGS